MATQLLKSFCNRRSPRRGAMMVLIAITLPIIIIIAAFALDVAWMQLVRTELRTATDSASRAGAKTLSLKQNTTDARNAAKQAALRNTVAGDPLQLQNSEIEFTLTKAMRPRGLRSSTSPSNTA